MIAVKNQNQPSKLAQDFISVCKLEPRISRKRTKMGALFRMCTALVKGIGEADREFT